MKTIIERLCVVFIYVSIAFAVGALFWLIAPWIGVVAGICTFWLLSAGFAAGEYDEWRGM